MLVKEALCRKAQTADVGLLFQLIKGYADKGIMLPRSKEALLRQMDSFVVAEVDGELVGCGSLTRLAPDLVEVRSLGITEGYKGCGIGSSLVGLLIEQAREQGIPKIMALTYEVRFFERNGFAIVNKEIFPEKVWTDCVHCPKRHACDEIAMLRMI